MRADSRIVPYRFVDGVITSLALDVIVRYEARVWAVIHARNGGLRNFDLLRKNFR